MTHEIRIEDNGMKGEDAAWLPACSCGWVGVSSRKQSWATEDAEHHVRVKEAHEANVSAMANWIEHESSELM